MTQDERTKKAMHRIDSALRHMSALSQETAADEVWQIIGHLKRAQELLCALNFSEHNEGKKLVQMELF